MSKLPLFVVIAFVTLISGCAKTEWWVGTWKMDLDVTGKHLDADPQIKPRVADNLKQMLAKNGDWEVTVTPTDITYGKDATVKKPYKVTSETAKSIVLQSAEHTETFTLDGEYLVADFAKNMPVKLYFKRVK